MSGKYHVQKWQGDETPDAEKLRAAMESDGYQILDWSDRPGTTYAMHEHAEDQSHCIISGEIEFVIENEGTFVLGAGDRDYLPAGTRHSARVIGDEIVFYMIGAKV